MRHGTSTKLRGGDARIRIGKRREFLITAPPKFPGNPSATIGSQPLEIRLSVDRHGNFLRQVIEGGGRRQGAAMSLGRRTSERQAEFWIVSSDLAGRTGHIFYDRLNKLLDETGFDTCVENLCRPHYEPTGRPSNLSVAP